MSDSERTSDLDHSNTVGQLPTGQATAANTSIAASLMSESALRVSAQNNHKPAKDDDEVKAEGAEE